MHQLLLWYLFFASSNSTPPLHPAPRGTCCVKATQERVHTVLFATCNAPWIFHTAQTRPPRKHNRRLFLDRSNTSIFLSDTTHANICIIYTNSIAVGSKPCISQMQTLKIYIFFYSWITMHLFLSYNTGVMNSACAHIGTAVHSHTHTHWEELHHNYA